MMNLDEQLSVIIRLIKIFDDNYHNQESKTYKDLVKRAQILGAAINLRDKNKA